MEPTLPPLLPPSAQAVTRLLSAWREGDSQALESLTPLIYEELRLLAQRYMRRERNSHTLQATAVVHEAFVRMVDMQVSWQDRNHFYAVAAKLMRRILVDHAKSKSRIKRGGQVDIEHLEEDQLSDRGPVTQGELDVLELDEALQQLAQLDERLANTIELHYFAGLTCAEIGVMQEVSEATVHRNLRLAKAWILKQLRSGTTKNHEDSM